MAISDEGVYICEYCGQDVGYFNQDTGNHVACEKNAVLKREIRILKIQLSAAQNYIDSNICDNDTTAEMWKAWKRYQRTMRLKP